MFVIFTSKLIEDRGEVHSIYQLSDIYIPNKRLSRPYWNKVKVLVKAGKIDTASFNKKIIYPNGGFMYKTIEVISK